MDQTRPRITAVINYYNPKAFSRIEAICLLCLESLRFATKNTLEIILADGSGVESEQIRQHCQRLSAVYTLSPVPQNFGAIYNHGMSLAKGEYIAILENDVFVVDDWDEKMLSEMNRTGANLAVPYLTSCDSQIQEFNFVARHFTFEPSCLSHNLMLFDRTAFNAVYPLDTQFNASFNDHDMYQRLRAAGLRFIVCDAGKICHYRRSSSAYNPWTMERDVVLFRAKYPNLPYWNLWGEYSVATPLFCRSFLFRLLLKLMSGIGPMPVSRYLYKHAFRLEPIFHRI
jgi:GT2 family glycosyltransferase